jgi:hypothetical protein
LKERNLKERNGPDPGISLPQRNDRPTPPAETQPESPRLSEDPPSLAGILPAIARANGEADPGPSAWRREIAEPKAEPELGVKVEKLTEGQIAFIASLPEACEAVFLRMTKARQAQTLAPHAAGIDEHCRRIQLHDRSILAPRPPEPPPRPMPETVEELLGQLRGSPWDWWKAAACALMEDFGEARDRKLWGEFHQIAQVVAWGRADAEHLVSAYRQAMKPGIRVRGAKFWAAWQELTGLDSDGLKEALRP